MQNLEPPESHFLAAATGWLGLGNLQEAELELSRLSAAWQQHPDVLEVRWALRASQKRWEDALQVARSLIHTAPDRVSGWIHQAYSLRRASSGGLDAAWNALLPMADKFPEEPTIPYNLACYACQMQQIETARFWLKRAIKLGGEEPITKQALADEDLKALWDEIRIRYEPKGLS